MSSLSPRDLCDDFAAAVAGTRYEKLQPAAIDAAKKSILDTLGVIVAASGMEPAVRPLIEHLVDCGGKPESSVLGWGQRLPASAAALANGAMAHCLDFDDRTSRGGHCASAMIPAVFALAQRNGPVPGQRVIAAVAAAQDMFIRLRCNVAATQTWNVSTILGVFSATAAAATILGLGESEIANALAIASMQAGGTMQPVYGGTHLRGMYAGFSANVAVNAALLAERGLSGIHGVFEGKAGILQACFAGKYDRDQIVSGLGQHYLGSDMVYKPWPVVGLSHTYIHATLQLMALHGLRPWDVEQIRVFISESQQQMCLPLERRRRPQSAVDAKFSLPFVIGVAASKGQVALRDFTPEALNDPQVLDMAQKVLPTEEPGEAWKSNSLVGRVEILAKDGRRFECVGARVPGSPEAPMSWEQLARKFTDCASAAVTPIAPDKVEEVIRLVKDLDSLDDAAAVVAPL
ncbi:MAG: MmgE/PrpD family protein [Variovorax sp.]|nr:MAG: MmgE/PrpD family protein [Variovorax sp.]